MPTRNLGDDTAFGTQNLNLKTESWYKQPLNTAIAQDIPQAIRVHPAKG